MKQHPYFFCFFTLEEIGGNPAGYVEIRNPNGAVFIWGSEYFGRESAKPPMEVIEKTVRRLAAAMKGKVPNGSTV